MPHFESFDDVTRRRVADRLIATACARYGLALVDAAFAGYSVNVVYRVTAERDGVRAEYALRISDPAVLSTPPRRSRLNVAGSGPSAARRP